MKKITLFVAGKTADAFFEELGHFDTIVTIPQESFDPEEIRSKILAIIKSDPMISKKVERVQFTSMSVLFVEEV